MTPLLFLLQSKQMENTAFTCLALSPAGCVPQFGQNSFHEYQGKKMHCVGYFCGKSETTVGVAGGGKEFAAHHWNRKHAKNGIDAPEGWSWAQLTFKHLFIGGQKEMGKDFIGFKVEGDIGKSFKIHLFDLTTQKISTVCIPQFKGNWPILIDISE